MVEAFIALEAAGVVHNDLHEGNWLVTKADHTGNILMNDFGRGRVRYGLEGATGGWPCRRMKA
jgi:thiamine kinase-like enzyme